MDIFSSSDYYPTPSNNVVRYKESDGFRAKRSVLNAELVGLITDLSSPIEAVDYTVISDFFLVYRNFLNPIQLEEILILRFRWCIAEIMVNEETQMKRRRIGEIALVRTFVLLRHWVLNYFVQDFLVDVNLRIRFIKFLNLGLGDLPKIVQCTMINLKKSWVHHTKKVWTNLELDEPKPVGEDDLWVVFEIKDFTELDELKKRDSRLSAYAIQSSSSPTFRNRSVLSLYKSSDVFQLPVPQSIDKRRRNNRTASMVLFPQDNSNIDSRVPNITVISNQTSHMSNTLRNQNGINRLSKLTKVSTAMKDIKYPATPGIDKVIPPTPAKKVELILQLPEDNTEKDKIINRQNQNHDDVKTSASWGKIASINLTAKGRISRSTSRASSTIRDSVIHYGALGLLSKWRKNHACFDNNNNNIDLDALSLSSKMEKVHEQNSKKEMDNFVKYVISITSLEDRNFGANEMANLVETKFDLLSARTIEEVEYLVSLENDLIRELQQTPTGSTADVSSAAMRNAEEEENAEEETEDTTHFSAMDNLNLYQTVNSIANSVFSLSKSLNQYKQQQQQTQSYKTSPSVTVLERYKPQGAVPLMKKNSQILYGLPNQTIIKGEDPKVNETAPQRLVFHDSNLSNGSANAKGPGILRAHTPSISSLLTPTKGQSLEAPIVNSSSKGILPNLKEQRETSQNAHNNDGYSTSSYMSYDSHLFDKLHNQLYSAKKRSKRLSVHPSQVPSSNKGVHRNVREFSFENGNKIKQNRSEEEDSEREESQSLSSFVTTNTTNYEMISDCENSFDYRYDNESSIYRTQSPSVHIKEGQKKNSYEEKNPGNGHKHYGENGAEESLNRLEHIRNGVKNTVNEFRNERPPDISVRPASGRVSLGKRKTDASLNQRESSWSAAQRVAEDPYYVDKDKELREKEKELVEIEQNMRNRMSAATSVDTAMLFSSGNESPRRCTTLESENIHLSTTPTIRSISNGQSDSGFDTSETYGESIQVPTTSASSTNHWDLPHINNLEIQASAESSFNYSPAGSENDLGRDVGNVGARYLFTPENEDIDFASPDKNVEALKNRFFEDNDSSQDEESRLDNDTPLKNKEDPRNLNRGNGENTNMDALLKTLDSAADDTPRTSFSSGLHRGVDWNGTQDSEADDPINVALMKLEGTYEREKSKMKQNSGREGIPVDGSSASILSHEVNMLGIPDVDDRLEESGTKRRSLLIETRRQSVMNVPYTPKKAAKPVNKQKHLTLQVKDLINLYEIKDPNLLVANCEQHIPFILMYDSLSIARQMTLIEKELLSEVDWKDLLDVNLTYSGPSVTSWLQLLVQNESLSGVDLAIARFNLTVDWIISEIVLTSDIRLKRNTIQRFIHVADHCRSFQNYNTLMEIVLALNSAAVQKCIEAWRLIEPGDLITWGELKKIPSLDRNYSYIRKLLNNIDPIKGCAPFIVVYLSDLSLNNEKRTWVKENQVVNYNKFETNVQIVKNFIQRVQWSKFYNFREDHELLSKCVYLTALSRDEITQVINKLNKSD